MMADQQLIQALIARDEKVTLQFFFKDCRPLFCSIIRNVFSYEVDYDEFVNEFYLYLMENDAYRLRLFRGRSSIYQWMKIVAIRYFVAKRDSMIDMESKETLFDNVGQDDAVDDERRISAKMDVERLFRLMPNKRYVYVIRRLVLEDANPRDVADELGINVDNLYNVKKRAIAALMQVALKDVKRYEEKVC